MRTRAQDADSTMALDVPYLSTTFGLPEPDLQTLIDDPTTELVKQFLTSLTAKAHEYDALKSEKLKVDVELENTVRTSETKVKAQKAAVNKHVKEIEELGSKLNEAESARETLSSELEQLRSSTSGSTAETQTLRQRIETLEASNRDAFALVESKSTEKDRVSADLSEQHTKLLTLRREVGQLEERNQALENAGSSQKFKEQSLQQEIDLLKRNNEWHANELQTRSQEHAKFRKERNARIASLQRELEDSSASVDTLKRTETNLRQRLEEVQGKADEAFARIAGLEEEYARKEQGWKTEFDGSKRLGELQAQNAATHKARLQEVQERVEQIKEAAAQEVGDLQAEVETERSDKEQSERRVAELELKVEQLEQQPRASRPGTPMNNGAFDPATPGRVGSPFTLSGSLRKSKMLTNTEWYTKYNEMQTELEAERRRTQKLSNTMDEMLADAENHGPELLELRSDQEKLEEEVLSFSRLLEDANANRDNAIKDSERWESEAESRAREGDVLRQQLRDLSAQVKILLVEVQSRDQGLEGMSGQERFQLEQAARGEMDAWSENETTTQQLISHQLVIFRDVASLQEQNQKLLQLTRTLGDQMEGNEAQKKAAESEANAQEVEELRQQVARYKDELQATATQIDSYVKERDMFRRMLHHRGQLNPDSDLQAMFGQSVPPATPQRDGADAVAQTPRSKDVEDLNKLLKEQQTFFDQYRNESAQDRKVLKDQVDALGRDKSALQADLAHWKSQKTLAEERLQMLQNNYSGLQAENRELQQRSQQMAEQAAKQDLRTQQVAEELVEAKSMAESLRNENANARAEKDLWKRIEARLTEDNKGLMDERSRLNKLVADLQNLQNERELADSESRRRLQTRVEGLEAELGEMKKRLERETDDGRKATLRREYEGGQSRTRIDDLVKSLGNVREELVAAKTTRDQLQSRVDEMKIELRSAEERAAALQPRPTPRPAQAQQNGEQQTNGEDEELSSEQRLALEVSDLRRDLELARNELENARQQVEQYRGIAQATEEELASFNETSEQYKEETDRQIAEKDGRVQELQQRVDDLLAELTTTNNELSELRTKHDDASRVLNEQKTSSETAITHLKDDAERHAEEKKLYQEDLKAQAEIAQQAQQSYEDELLKHAEAARSLQSVRKEYNELRTEVAGVRAEAEAAKASLERGKESWTEQKERFESELEEVKRRKTDMDEQNRLLHQQMESFSSELVALRSGRAVAGSGEGDERAGTPSGDANMQEVIKYLRREKEIVDVQYELSMQESKRLQQQLEYANAQLEETRQKLAEERRQSSDKVATEGSTNKLMQTINELNLFRESSTTLRNEARQSREKLEEKSKEVERLLTEIEPLKGKAGELEGEIEGKDGEIKLLQQDRDHWRERTQNIISKYDRVDPAELEEMKRTIEALNAEKERLETEQAPLREQVEGIEKKVEEAVEENSKTFRDRLEKFRDQAKERNRTQVARIKEMETAVETANVEKTKVVEELESVTRELEEAKTALQNAQAKASHEAEEGQVDESVEASAADKPLIAEAEKRASENASRAEALTVELQTLQTQVQDFKSEITTLRSQLDNALQGEEGEIQSSAAADSETLEKLQQELSTAHQEVQTLRANASNAPTGDQSTTNVQSAPGEKSVADQVAEEVATLRIELEQQHEVAINQLKEQHEARFESLKTSLRNKLKEERDQMRSTVRQELVEEHSAELQKLKGEHEAAVAKLKQDHQAELERLTKEGGAAVAKAEDTTAVKSEPTSTEWPTEQQILELMKTNQRVKGIFNANINKRVAVEVETLKKAATEKDEEIARLKEAQTSADNAGASEEEKSEITKKLAAAEEQKQQAVAKAVEQESKKAKVQVSMLNIAQAKITAVKKAVQETPEKAVKEVWEVADKVKPVPKPAAAAASTPVASSSSPAATAAKPAMPSSPAQAQPQTEAVASAAPTAPTASAQDLTEEEKTKQRQARFGTGPPDVAAQTGSMFGQPSAPSSGIQPPATTTASFGQPSQAGPLGQPARRPSNAGVPSATGEGPGQQMTRRTSQQNARGGSALPRAGGAAGRGGAAAAAPSQIKGAAVGTQPDSTPQRGGSQSGLPRAGGAAGRGGGGRGGGPPRGGSGPAGQKRQHDGGNERGDEKRTRGGGGAGGGA